jgi:hypothetical protein
LFIELVTVEVVNGKVTNFAKMNPKFCHEMDIKFLYNGLDINDVQRESEFSDVYVLSVNRASICVWNFP